MVKQYWTASWKQELFGEDDAVSSEEEIKDFCMGDNNPLDMSRSAALRETAETGIPDYVDREEIPRPRPAAAAARTMSERAAHPDHSGPLYDNLHDTQVKHIAKCMQEWRKQKETYEVAIQKVGDNKLAEAGVKLARQRIAAADKDFETIVKADTDIKVHGKG